jgi:hypothetical protein
MTRTLTASPDQFDPKGSLNAEPCIYGRPRRLQEINDPKRTQAGSLLGKLERAYSLTSGHAPLVPPKYSIWVWCA